MQYLEDYKVEQVRILRYQYLNRNRSLFGGALMQWIDELGGVAAGKYAESAVVTAAVDSLVFEAPAYLEDIVFMTASVTYVGNTSIEVRVDSYIEDFIHQKRNRINRAYLVFVSIDENGKPKHVEKRLQPHTEGGMREWGMGKRRQELRSLRRKERY